MNEIDTRNLVEVELPDIPGFYGSDGVCIKPMIFKNAGVIAAQHSHKYAHTSYIATGAVRVWCEGRCVGDFLAPAGIEIKAETKHEFMSLLPNTTVLCIHNVGRTGEIEVVEEHALTFTKGG